MCFIQSGSFVNNRTSLCFAAVHNTGNSSNQPAEQRRLWNAMSHVANPSLEPFHIMTFVWHWRGFGAWLPGCTKQLDQLRQVGEVPWASHHLPCQTPPTLCPCLCHCPTLRPSEPGVSRSYTPIFTLWPQKEKENLAVDWFILDRNERSTRYQTEKDPGKRRQGRGRREQEKRGEGRRGRREEGEWF